MPGLFWQKVRNKSVGEWSSASRSWTNQEKAPWHLYHHFSSFFLQVSLFCHIAISWFRGLPWVPGQDAGFQSEHTLLHTSYRAPNPHPWSLPLISRLGLMWSLSSVYLCELFFLHCSLLESSRTGSWSSSWASSWLSPSWRQSLFLSEDTDVSALPW